jgi:hypothetical protein
VKGNESTQQIGSSEKHTLSSRGLEKAKRRPFGESHRRHSYLSMVYKYLVCCIYRKDGSFFCVTILPMALLVYPLYPFTYTGSFEHFHCTSDLPSPELYVITTRYMSFL